MGLEHLIWKLQSLPYFTYPSPLNGAGLIYLQDWDSLGGPCRLFDQLHWESGLDVPISRPCPMENMQEAREGLSQDLHNLYILVVLDEGNQFQEWPAKIWGPVNHDVAYPE